MLLQYSQDGRIGLLSTAPMTSPCQHLPSLVRSLSGRLIQQARLANAGFTSEDQNRWSPSHQVPLYQGQLVDTTYQRPPWYLARRCGAIALSSKGGIWLALVGCSFQ